MLSLKVPLTMSKQNARTVYFYATHKSWNIAAYNAFVKDIPGEWHLFTRPEELSAEKVRNLKPRFIFFPHWSYLVPDEILNLAECVCFHETALPFGRGGSPIQNLISLGIRETKISSIKMTPILDGGPIYCQETVSLEGLAEEIFIRVSRVVAKMVKTIIDENPKPRKQRGTVTTFRRRKPLQSLIGTDMDNLDKLFDHIRMLDAEGYPLAFLEVADIKFEFSRPSRRTNCILADVRISKKD
jgi:methionyl-tRNA formyltransferase